MDYYKELSYLALSDEKMQKSINYTIKVLGYKGLEKADKTKNDLRQAMECSNNNL